MRIEIFTDGACSGNPGKGGYGIVMKVPEKNYEKRFSKGFLRTTNNRMELAAVIDALEKLRNAETDVHVFTDSKYVADAISKKWIYGWQRKGWVKVKNPDLWQKLLPLLKLHTVTFHWIKGHAGHPENELCDQLAVAAAQGKTLHRDEYFENQGKDGLFDR